VESSIAWELQAETAMRDVIARPPPESMLKRCVLLRVPMFTKVFHHEAGKMSLRAFAVRFLAKQGIYVLLTLAGVALQCRYRIRPRRGCGRLHGDVDESRQGRAPRLARFTG
jgi:hypothetical protein